MPSIGSLVLRFFGVFAVTLILAFFGLALAIAFLDAKVSGPLPFLAILGLAQLAGSISAGKLIGQTTGEVPGELFILRTAILTSATALLSLLVLLIQAQSAGWIDGLPGLDDPEMRDSLLLGGAIFFAASAILGRFGLIFGARAGRRQHVKARPRFEVQDASLEIYHSPHGHAHPQPSSYPGFAEPLPGPGVLAMIGRMFLLNIIGGAILGVGMFVIMRQGGNGFLFVNAGSLVVTVAVCFLTGSYYGRRARRPMSPEFAWGVAGGYTMISTFLTIAAFGAFVLLLDPPMPQLPKDAAMVATLTLVIFLVMLVVVTFVMKALLRMGSRSSAPSSTL